MSPSRALMKNTHIADLFERMANVLEIKGANAFKVNAYRKAGRVLRDLQTDIEHVWKGNELDSIPGIGQAMAKKIDEYLRTGRITRIEETIESVPPSLLDLLNIQNLGPRTLSLIHTKMGVEDLDGLKKVMEDGSLSQLEGMGPKKIEKLRKGIEFAERRQDRHLFGDILPLVEEVMAALRRIPGTGRLHPTGSIRRMKETVGDIDILIETDDAEKVFNAFSRLPIISEILSKGPTRASFLTGHGTQVDLRGVKRESYGAALQYFTGSQAHNVKIRHIARTKGLKVNEYGIFRGEQSIGGEKEEEIYNSLEMEWIPPELREDRGEIEAAVAGKLPQLVELYDINGDFHIHTDWSDGNATLEAMVSAARTLGYTWVGICDHSESATYAGGLTPAKLEAQIRAIEDLNTQIKDIRILTGTEVDILPDGTLDFPDELLHRLDVVIASVHSGFDKRVTDRLIAAANHPAVKIIAHPTGRVTGQREGYIVDLDKVMEACSKTDTAMEINAAPDRMDLDDVNARKAAVMGVKLAISTDAHSTGGLDHMRLGLGVARRAWLTKADVLNSRG